jgi:hypothetical protein
MVQGNGMVAYRRSHDPPDELLYGLDRKINGANEGKGLTVRTTCESGGECKPLHEVMSNACVDPRTEKFRRLTQVTSIVLCIAWK